MVYPGTWERQQALMLSRCHPHNDARCGKTEAVFPAAFPRVPRVAFRKQDISSVKQHPQSLFKELWSQQRETFGSYQICFFPFWRDDTIPTPCCRRRLMGSDALAHCCSAGNINCLCHAWLRFLHSQKEYSFHRAVKQPDGGYNQQNELNVTSTWKKP